MFRWYDKQNIPCNEQAYLYYLGVRYFGAPAYNHRTAYAPMNHYA
jgi:hypothetical protein